MSDAEWLADVAAHGMVRPSFVPPPDIRGLRELTRYRKTQIRARGQEIQRLEKLFQDAGFKLTSVASSVWSQSSRSEEHTSELQSLMSISYDVFCLKTKN